MRDWTGSYSSYGHRARETSIKNERDHKRVEFLSCDKKVICRFARYLPENAYSSSTVLLCAHTDSFDNGYR